MVSEPHVAGSELGELQLAMWRRQFQALRDGDRFFYLNDPLLPLIQRRFGIDYRRSLADIIRANTRVDVQRDVFTVPAEEEAQADEAPDAAPDASEAPPRAHRHPPAVERRRQGARSRRKRPGFRRHGGGRRDGRRGDVVAARLERPRAVGVADAGPRRRGVALRASSLERGWVRGGRRGVRAGPARR
jgi:Animal haem peroxidase